jgi:hypothetical protein
MNIGSYTLADRLGAGSMGIVFRALDPSNNAVALKMIGSVAQINATVHAGRQIKNAPAMDETRRIMFIREARVAMGLNHPNIARVFDYGQDHGLLYIVMEFLEGRSLDKVIGFQSAIPIPQKLSIIRQLCEALSHAHKQGIIHRDIKAANCFVLRDLSLKVLDFGIAARMHEDGQAAALVGTHTHMAPELFAPVPHYTERTDIWAAGVTLYHLLTGKLPFDGRSFFELVWNIRNSPYAPIPNAAELEGILSRCLHKDPASRFASAREFADALRALEPSKGEPKAREAAIVEPPGEAPASGEAAADEDSGAASIRQTVSVISRGFKGKPAGIGALFAVYKRRVVPAVLTGSVAALSYPIFYVLARGGPQSGLRTALTIAGYSSGLIVPALVILGVWMAIPVVWEKISNIPKCQRCRMALKHKSRVTTYSNTLDSYSLAVSDCLAALRENLWEDACKLLSMHGESAPPTFDRKTLYPPRRLQLDFYHCQCGDETALLIAEYPVGRTWIQGEKFEGAYRSHGSSEIEPTFRQRAERWFKAVESILPPITAPLPPWLACMVTAAGLLIASYYYPQFPILTGADGYRVPIVVQSDPPGPVCSVGFPARDFATPHTFRWNYASDHEISCVDMFYGNGGTIYKFAGLLPRPASQPNDRSGRPPILHDFAIRVDVWRDRWGSVTMNPIIPAYTVQYALAGKYDFVADARASLEAAEKMRAREKAAKLTPVFGNGRYPTIRVTSIPRGLTVLVDGVRVVTPIIYVWELGSYHTLEVPNEQQECCPDRRTGSRFYSGGKWDFGSKENIHRVHINWSAIPFPTTYTAKFTPTSTPEGDQMGKKTSVGQAVP